MIQLRALHALVLLCLLSPSGFVLADSFDTGEAETSIVERFRDGLEELEVEELRERVEQIMAALMDMAGHDQDIRQRYEEARRAGRDDESIRAMQDEINQMRHALERAIDELPDVAVIVAEINAHQQEMFNLMQLRTEAYRLLSIREVEANEEE
jgi:flagellar biosynthesis chaperone FliJ